MNAFPAMDGDEAHGSPWARRAGALALRLAQAARVDVLVFARVVTGA
jgi:hypothetical protein